LVDDFLAFFSPYKALEGLMVLAKLNPFRKGQAAAHLSSTALKKNLPAWKKIAIDMEHIASGHMAGGTRVSNLKTLFSNYMSEKQVEMAVRNAYKNVTDKLQTQGERILLRGKTDSGLIIEMWVNTSTKTIETAYPKF